MNQEWIRTKQMPRLTALTRPQIKQYQLFAEMVKAYHFYDWAKDIKPMEGEKIKFRCNRRGSCDRVKKHIYSYVEVELTGKISREQQRTGLLPAH